PRRPRHRLRAPRPAGNNPRPGRARYRPDNLEEASMGTYAISTSSGRSDRTAAAYEALRQQHLREMRARVPEILQRLDWPADRLKAERQRRLRDLVRIAKRTSAWQRARLTRIDPERVTEASLQDITPMTKEDLMANFDAVSTDPRVTLDAAEAHLASLQSNPY